MRDRLGVVRSGNAPTREVKRAVDVAGAEKGDVAFNARDASLPDEEFFGRVAPTPSTVRRSSSASSDATTSSEDADARARAQTKGASARDGGDGSVNDSAGSDEGVAGTKSGEEKPKTRGQKMMDAMRRAKDRAKAGIVNIPKGSTTRAKHGLAKNRGDIRKEKEDAAKQRIESERLGQVASLMKSQRKQFDISLLDDFLEKEENGFNLFGDDEDDEDEMKQTAKYEDDDEYRSIFVMHPTTKLRQYWDFLQVFLLLYIAISVPYRLGFSEPSYGPWYVADFFVDIYFYVDMVFNFFTAYWETSADDDDFHYVTNLWKIQKHYLKGWFTLDALSLLPIDYISRSIDGTSACSWESELACGDAAKTTQVPEALRLLKMLRLLRVVRTTRILERYQETLLRIYKLVTIGRLLALLVLLSHWMACLYAYVYNFQREDASGVDGKKNHMYIAALFWSVQTLTTVGYGNVVPTTVSERIIAIIVMITGGFVFSAIISGVNMSMDEDSPGNRFAVRMNHVRELLAEHKMPSGLKSRVRSHYKQSVQPQKLVNRDIINPLPEAIRADVNFYIYGKAMAKGLRASGNVAPEGIIIEILCRTMDTHMFARGTRLCYPYELAEKLIITLNGRVTYSPDEASGFHHADVMKIKRKSLREQQIELAEEKGLLRGPGTVINPGLLSGFHKGILCAMPFDKNVEALTMESGVFYDMCAQHQPELLRNFQDEFLHSLSELNKPKMARIALSECDMRKFLEPTTRNVCSNWRELLEDERKSEDKKKREREQVGALGVVQSGGMKDFETTTGTSTGATVSAIKLALQQMHADIVHVSEQIAQVMVVCKDTCSMSESAGGDIARLIISNDSIEEKQINMELNVEAVYQALQNIVARDGGAGMEAMGWSGGGASMRGGGRSMNKKQVYDFTKSGDGGAAGTSKGVAPFSALQSDAIRARIEEAARKGTKISVTSHVDKSEETWERERKPTVGIQRIRKTSGSGPPPIRHESNVRNNHILDEAL